VGKILLVDDDAQIRRLIKVTLGSQGHALLEADDGFPAIELARLEKPDVMILDMTMPGLDGTEVCRQIKSSPETNSIDVVMLTARTDENLRRQAMDAGARLFIVKPFSPLALLGAIQDLLAKP
jgi:two-component system, OmpR family, alkaline phosphatase synthesis response regulator PhoP